MIEEMLQTINSLGTDGAMGIAIFFGGTNREAKVMRVTPNERYCVHLSEVHHPIWCDTAREVLRAVALRS